MTQDEYGEINQGRRGTPHPKFDDVMTDTTDFLAMQTPLLDLLRAVPADARLVIDDGPYSTHHIPVGRYCQEAAALLADRAAAPSAEAPTGEGTEPSANMLVEMAERHGMDYTRHSTMLDFARAVWRLGRDAAPQAAAGAPDDVRAAIRDYHFALDSREHGGLAARHAVFRVQAALGMPWLQGAEAARRALAAQQEGGKP